MAVNGADSVAIHIEGLASSIEKDMASNDPFMSPNCCIFKTPTILYRLNDKAYVPDAFSIGPFHHSHPNLADTEKIKKKYLHGLISRSPSPETKLRDLINSVNEVQTEARECYSKPIGYSPDEFVKILVIDSCFIIELFRKEANQVPREDNDPIFSMSCLQQFLDHDLILLENQVPWVVLERLFNKTKEEHDMPLIELAIDFFISAFSFTEPPPMNQTMIKDIKHIPDLIRKWMVSSTEQVEESPCLVSFRGEKGWQPMPCARSLEEAGIKFRRVESKSILDIKFNDGVLEIPPLLIQDTTETVFRNIISFEQCYPNCEDRFTSYAILMDSLINTVKDADILGKNEILDNWLNPLDAVQLFKNLHHNTCYNEYYYQSLSRDVSRYCQRRWPRWRAALVRNYFNTPWALFSTSAAVMILILTLLQTVYSIKR